jgi:hypothetical protein
VSLALTTKSLTPASFGYAVLGTEWLARRPYWNQWAKLPAAQQMLPKHRQLDARPNATWEQS